MPALRGTNMVSPAEYRTKQLDLLERIAEALEKRIVIEQQNNEMARAFTEFIQIVINIDKPNLVGPPVFGPDDPYDPEDDIEQDLDPEVGICLNCGHTITRTPGTTWTVCGECHHPNPEVDHEKQTPEERI